MKVTGKRPYKNRPVLYASHLMYEIEFAMNRLGNPDGTDVTVFMSDRYYRSIRERVRKIGTDCGISESNGQIRYKCAHIKIEDGDDVRVISDRGACTIGDIRIKQI